MSNFFYEEGTFLYLSRLRRQNENKQHMIEEDIIMKKRIIVLGLVFAMLLTAAGAVASTDKTPAQQATTVADNTPAIDAPTAMPEEAVPYNIGVEAVVTAIHKDNGRVSFEVQPTEGAAIILNLSDATILLDNQQAIPVGVDDIKVGDKIYAYHDIMMTMSIPGQTPAIAILTNLGEGAVAKLHMPERVEQNDEGASALCDNGSIWVRTAKDTVFTPYRTRQMVSAADIRMGQPFLAWYDIVMESAPAQAVAKRVMILPSANEEQALNLVVDGDMVISAKMVDGTVVVPARLTAEALGLKVGYRQENGKAFVTISNGTGELSMTMGEDAYSYRATASGTVGATAALPYGAAPHTAPYMEGASVTWMSAEAFELLGYEVSLAHGELSIRK